MGVFISLSLFPDAISDAEWTAYYDEACTFVQKYPLKLVRRQRTIVDTTQWRFPRYTYVRDLECVNSYTQAKELVIQGSLPLSFGETCVIPSTLSFRRKKEGDTPASTAFLDLLRQKGDARNIFCIKTQGKEYHFCILALGLLAEWHFPGRALVSGDITSSQGKVARDELHNILKRDGPLPIVTSPKRLYTACLETNHTSATPIELLDAVIESYCGETASELTAVIDDFPRDLVKEWYLKNLCEQTEKTLGMTFCFTLWLNATQDIASLIRMACLDPDGPKMSLEMCAYHLINAGSALPKYCAHQLAFLRGEKTEEVPVETVNTLMGHFFLEISGITCLRARYCFGEEAVMAALQDFLPANDTKIRTMVHTKTKDLQEHVQHWYDKYANAYQEITDDFGKIGEESFLHWISVDALTPSQKELLEGLVDNAKIVYTLMYKALQVDGRFTEASRTRCYLSIVHQAEERHYALPEEVWQRIDAEKDLALLVLYSLVLLKDNGESGSRSPSRSLSRLCYPILLYPDLAQYVCNLLLKDIDEDLPEEYKTLLDSARSNIWDD